MPENIILFTNQFPNNFIIIIIIPNMMSSMVVILMDVGSGFALIFLKLLTIHQFLHLTCSQLLHHKLVVIIADYLTCFGECLTAGAHVVVDEVEGEDSEDGDHDIDVE
jgi:hypothetical protein